MKPPEEASGLARVMAIARRDAQVQLSYKFALLTRLGGVLVFGTTLFFISKLVGDPPALADYEGDYFGFALIGVVMTVFAAMGLGTLSRSIADEQQGGTLEVLMSVPVPLAVVLGGTLVVPVALTVLDVLVYGTAAAGFGIRFSARSMLLALPVLMMTTASFSALGVVSAAFTVLTKRGDPLAVLVTSATSLLAGSLFPVSVLPGWLQAASKAMPAYYGLRAMRSTLLLDAGVGDIARDVVILSVVTAALLPLALFFFSWTLRVARVSGTLGTY